MAQIPVTSEAAFETLLASIAEDAATASIHWRLCKDLFAAVPEFVTELNEAPAFWSLTMNAHREVTLFRLGRLYDQQNGALSLRSLVDTISANRHLFDVDRFRERLKGNPFIDSLADGARQPEESALLHDAASVSEEGDPLVRKLLAIRNRVLAHRDARVALGVVADPAGTLAPPDIDALLERAATVVNRYSIMFRAGSHAMWMFGGNDWKQVLRRVRNDLNTTKSRIAAEIACAEKSQGERSAR
ncbi:MAG: hypothetical protein NT151_08875 [Acidobacteria bacterium]|nr:hypothetical protein [Acidobacteriota bacterium]